MNEKAQAILDDIVDLIALDVEQLGELLKSKAKRKKPWTSDHARRLDIYAGRLDSILRRAKPGDGKNEGLDKLMERALAIPELRDSLMRRAAAVTKETNGDDD